MDKTVALYMRLSDEDDNLAAHEESNSISHQRKQCKDRLASDKSNDPRQNIS